MANPPIVLVFAGNDPTGGAGIQADIEAIASQGCHAAPVVTALTVQNSSEVLRSVPVAGELVEAQARAVLDDMPVNAVKIGLVPDSDCVSAIHRILTDFPGIPVILDPVLAAGNGRELVDSTTRLAIHRQLLPLTTVLTPNSLEARLLAAESHELEQCAAHLIEQGCERVLITGEHEPGDTVINTLYDDTGLRERYEWMRLPNPYHGSGCTLAASIAALLANYRTIDEAVATAQRYTNDALRHAHRPGKGQHLPDRLFWTREE